MRPWMGFALLPGLVLAGCRSGESEFPMSVGSTWTYSIRTGLLTRVETVKVERELSVAGVSGYELSSPLGVCRLAWKDGVLIADALANSSFKPPLPLLVSGESSANRKWTGTMTVLGTTVPATASLDQSSETRRVAGKMVSTRKSVLTLKSKGNTVELITWFVPGVGPVLQEQRTNGLLDISLESLGDP